MQSSLFYTGPEAAKAGFSLRDYQQKDVCPECGCWWFSDPWTQDDNGDYPPLACERCNTLACQMAPEAIEIQQEADDKIAAIQAKWKCDCLTT